MRIPGVRLSSWLAVLGWILVVGGVVEGVDLFLHHHWSRPWWHAHSLFEALAGPAVHIGLGSALWALARR